MAVWLITADQLIHSGKDTLLLSACNLCSGPSLFLSTLFLSQLSHCAASSFASYVKPTPLFYIFSFCLFPFPPTTASDPSATRIHDLAWRPAIESGPSGNFLLLHRGPEFKTTPTKLRGCSSGADLRQTDRLTGHLQ